jgi:pyridoxal phosphate enzyme (YggS family)
VGSTGVRAGLADVRNRVEAAALAAGRDAASIRIVAVTKKLGADAVREAYAAGQRDFGENYVQEAVTKIAELAAEMPDARWHLIGRLQSNKAATAVRHFSLLQGIDSMRTVAAVSKAAIQEGRVADLLLQMNLDARDIAREGAAPPAPRGGVDAAEAASFLEQACAHEGIRFVGLMGVADPDRDVRPQFAGLRELAATLAALGLDRAPLGELSMGMTGDFEDAVAEGATIVRIGTAIFGERPRA